MLPFKQKPTHKKMVGNFPGVFIYIRVDTNKDWKGAQGQWFPQGKAGTFGW